MEDEEYQTYMLLISKSRLKSSIGTSTLMAGFALVSFFLFFFFPYLFFYFFIEHFFKTILDCDSYCYSGGGNPFVAFDSLRHVDSFANIRSPFVSDYCFTTPSRN